MISSKAMDCVPACWLRSTAIQPRGRPTPFCVAAPPPGVQLLYLSYQYVLQGLSVQGSACALQCGCHATPQLRHFCESCIIECRQDVNKQTSRRQFNSKQVHVQKFVVHMGPSRSPVRPIGQWTEPWLGVNVTGPCCINFLIRVHSRATPTLASVGAAQCLSIGANLVACVVE